MKKTLIVLLLGMFLISFASALEFDNFLNYDDSKDEIVITNAFNLGADLIKAQLQENGCDENMQFCSAIIPITLYEGGKLIEDKRFYTINGEDKYLQNVRSSKYEYWGSIDDYETQCEEKNITQENGTYIQQTCEQIKVGSHEDWIQFTNEEFVSGDYLVKFSGEKKPTRMVDWQIKIKGEWTTPWAVWGAVIGVGGVEANVTLNNPSDLSTAYTSLVTFNATAAVTGGAYLTNMSLCSNISSSWSCGDTVNLTPQTDTAGTTTAGLSGTAVAGYTIVPNINTRITKVTKISAVTATTAYIRNSGGSVLATSTFVGDNATFNYEITAGTTYQIVLSSGGASYNRRESVAGQTFPIVGTVINYTAGYYNTGTNSYYYNIKSITTRETTYSTKTFSKTITDTTIWNVQACDTDGDCGFSTSNYTVYLDAVAPTIALNYPTSLIDQGAFNKSLQLNFTATDSNLDKVWYNYNGTNITVTGALTGVASLSNITLSDKKNVTIYANDTAGNLNSTTFNWDYKVFENSRTHNTTSYETAYESYNINVTANSSLTAMALTYNGTDYSMTNQGSGIWSYSRDLPSSTIGNNSVVYKFTYGGSTINSDTSYQNVSSIIFTLCNGTYTTKFLNVTFKDEADSSVINASIPTSTFEYYLGSGTETKSYNYINSTENYYYAFCASPTDKIFNVDSYFQYKQGTDYPQRVSDADVLQYSNTTTNTTLYLLGVADGLYVTFQTINSAEQILSGVLVTASRLIESVSQIVGVGTTGDSGSVTLWLNPDFVHDFTFEKSGLTTVSSSFAPTQTGYTIVMGSVETVENSTIRGIKYSILPSNDFLENDTSYTFGFNLTSSFWDVTEYGFDLRLSNGTTITGDSTATEGTQLTKSYNVNNQSIIYLDAYWLLNGEYTNITRIWSVQNTEYSGYSIKFFFTDLSSYLDTDMFGLDNFGRNLIAFMIIFISVGIMAQKFGISSPIGITSLAFGMVLFFDVVTGIIPEIRGISHLPTFIFGLALVLAIINEVQSR